ncbi:spore germination protein [Paenibacillus agilis]|uniref:Spore germination protein n=1 Tax=Paenibacillus agilis TaxID=3020863 RepID=A0A559J1E9_9BACL|nr:spore germination protein [Paenibacillus agilis]TVX93671.1 spore germination protein [Paenibacillus agilis]
MPNKSNVQAAQERSVVVEQVDTNLATLSTFFTDNSNFKYRILQASDIESTLAICYLDILIDEKHLNTQLLQLNIDEINEDTIMECLSAMGTIQTFTDHQAIASFLFNAGFICFVQGKEEAYGIPIPGYQTRSIEESKTEPVVRGPRESFTEQIQTNLAMIYRRLKTPYLKTKKYTIGSNSNTEVQAVYLQHLVDKKVLAEFEKRIGQVKLDTLIESAQLEEQIQDHVFTPFPQIAMTERPDRIVAALNEGRIVVLVDGTPSVLIIPTLFTDFLQASEDYYERFYFANVTRALRILALVISLLGPSLYVALTTFHQEMLPTPLLLTFSAAKSGVPFPTFIEALIMEIAFELLREAGIRLPRTVGQTISIVGALIIGEAAVQSGIVSRPMVIVVATTGIASFAIPAFNAAIAFRIMRFPIMFIAAATGVFGIAICSLMLILHVSSLRSFGAPLLSPVAPMHWKSWLKNIFIVPYQLREWKDSTTSLPEYQTSQLDEYSKSKE